ncbi:MAG: hypothetical protein M1834_007226 [Cirrosporium novae-zelandiae]|nr:MAG: hypothetical protein M1834_007226 [Cirrosporium novae-zelandiae]
MPVHPSFPLYISRLASRLSPIYSLATSLPHPEFPQRVLNYYLLTSDQLDSLVIYYHQAPPKISGPNGTVNETVSGWSWQQLKEMYPKPIPWDFDATVEEKREHTSALSLLHAPSNSPESQNPSQASSKRPPITPSPSTPSLLSGVRGTEDKDLRRASDLVTLHYSVKVKQAQSIAEGGLDEGLLKARKDVDTVMRKLGIQ